MNNDTNAAMPSSLPRRMLAEAVGSFALVAAICAAAVFAFGNVGSLGILGVALCAGATLAAMVAALGNVSGAHFNPAVTLAAAVAGRFKLKEIAHYVIAQLVGGCLAAAAFASTLSLGGYPVPDAFAANGYGQFSPGGFPLAAVVFVEIVATTIFVLAILGATRDQNPHNSIAPLIIGVALAAGIIVAAPISGASLNPMRSTAAAIFADPQLLAQLWAFWIAPLIGGAFAGALSRTLYETRE